MPEVELTGKRKDLETVLADDKYGWDDPDLADYIEEGANVNEAKITLKRRYTENHPAITAGRAARIRNKMLEAVADGALTEEEFNNILSEYSTDPKRWMKRNAKFFNVSEDGIALSKFGKRALSAVVVNEEPVIDEGNAFGAARAKAIANGKDEFTVDGETYPVEDADKEDKENAEEFATESFVYESFSDFVGGLNEKKPSLSVFNGPGLIVIPNSKKDSNLIDQVAEEEALYGIFNRKENYWFFPEELGQTMDNLETQLEKALVKKGADVRYEAQYE